MSLEAVQIVAAWLADPEFGVNALLATVPRGAEALPPSVTIVNECDDGWIARNLLVPDKVKEIGPLIAVMQGGDASWHPTLDRPATGAATVDGESVVSLVYAERVADTAAGTLAAKHVMRATRGALWLLQDAETPAAQRTRNGVELVQLTALTMPAVDPERGDDLITAQLLATYATRESAQYRT